MQFLDFITDDVSANPSRISAIGSDLVRQIQSLVEGVDVDLDSPLSEVDE
jgi:hypothetical protein